MRSKLPTLAIISSGFLPIPAVKGGAVEALTENFLRENERQKGVSVTVYSNYDRDALTESKGYKFTSFKYIKTPWIVNAFDIIIYNVFKLICRKRNASSFRYIIQRLHFIRSVSKDLSLCDYNRVLFENQVIQLRSLKSYGNYSKYKNKYYFHIHNEISSTYGCRSYLLSGKNIAVSGFIADSLKELLGHEGAGGSYSVLRNSVDDNAFHLSMDREEKSALRKKFGIESDEKVILFAGRLSAEKGIDRLVEALKNINYSNYRLLVVGSSFFATNVRNSFVESLEIIAEPIKDKIIFTGYVDYKDMPRVYAISDVAVLPSVWDDPAPLTIIESLTSGTPIVTTKSGGIPEYVNDRCALIFDIDDGLVNNLSKGIDSLLANSDLRRKMSHESLLAAKDLTLRNYYGEMLSLLNLSGVNREY